MKVFHLRIVITCLLVSCGHAIPDYWPGRTYTSYNGTQITPVPFTILSEIVEYNIENSPRDAFLKTNLASYTPIDLWGETNDPPENRTGSVSRQISYLLFFSLQITKFFIVHSKFVSRKFGHKIAKSAKNLLETKDFESRYGLTVCFSLFLFFS